MEEAWSLETDTAFVYFRIRGVKVGRQREVGHALVAVPLAVYLP